MEKPLSFDDLWPHMEHLSDEEIDAINSVAGNSIRYRASLYGGYLVFLLAVTAIFYFVRATYLSHEPFAAVTLATLLTAVLAIWLGARLLSRLNHKIFNEAVMRELRFRQRK
jgi:uncharacterized membrane protein YfcA